MNLIDLLKTNEHNINFYLENNKSKNEEEKFKTCIEILNNILNNLFNKSTKDNYNNLFYIEYYKTVRYNNSAGIPKTIIFLEETLNFSKKIFTDNLNDFIFFCNEYKKNDINLQKPIDIELEKYLSIKTQIDKLNLKELISPLEDLLKISFNK